MDALESLKVVHSLNEALSNVPERQRYLRARIELASIRLLDMAVSNIEAELANSPLTLDQQTQMIISLLEMALNASDQRAASNAIIDARDMLLRNQHNQREPA